MLRNQHGLPPGTHKAGVMQRCTRFGWKLMQL